MLAKDNAILDIYFKMEYEICVYCNVSLSNEFPFTWQIKTFRFEKEVGIAIKVKKQVISLNKLEMAM